MHSMPNKLQLLDYLDDVSTKYIDNKDFYTFFWTDFSSSKNRRANGQESSVEDWWSAIDCPKPVL